MEKIKIIKIEDKDYPKRLAKIKNPPKKIYIEGNYELLNKDSISIVGSRNCTSYGWQTALDFSKELSMQNICIVSGMAMGIDKAAHEGAMTKRGKTIAVLGSGFNHIYPDANKDLYAEILKNNGCVIAEYPPEKEPDLCSFPKRNRIISGLSLGTLVIEATYRSGSTITAKYAIQENKPVFCIPSNINSKNGVGTNNLIKQGAELVTSPQDILEMYKLIHTEELEKEIPDEYKVIYKFLSENPLNVNEISRKSGINIGKTNSILSMMEIEGYAKSISNNQFIKV